MRNRVTHISSLNKFDHVSLELNDTYVTYMYILRLSAVTHDIPLERVTKFASHPGNFMSVVEEPTEYERIEACKTLDCCKTQQAMSPFLVALPAQKLRKSRAATFWPSSEVPASIRTRHKPFGGTLTTHTARRGVAPAQRCDGDDHYNGIQTSMRGEGRK